VSALLQARGVSKSFGGVHAVRNISLAVPEKSIFALIGPNGAGKSTLLAILATLSAPTSGSVRYGDATAREQGPAVRARLGALGHDLYLYPELTARENLDFFARLYRVRSAGARVEEALALVQKAVELDPQAAAYQDSMGWALFRLNRLEAAEQAVRRALEKDGENAVILDHLADILARRGRVAEALPLWQKALKGEDEEEELDRPRVEAKIREAQGALQAQQQPATPPLP